MGSFAVTGLEAPTTIERPSRKKPGPKPKWKDGTGNAKKDARFIADNPVSYMPDALSLTTFLTAPSTDIRTRYRETLTLSEALDELAKLRSIAQMAAEEINQRAVPDELVCHQCEKILPVGFKVAMIKAVRDPATGTQKNVALCSIECVRQYNKHALGLAELIK